MRDLKMPSRIILTSEQKATGFLRKVTEKRIYIYSQARKIAKGDNAVGVDDDTVFGWAVHYYDEDNIKVDKVQERVEVVASPAESAKVEQSKPQLKPQIKRKRVENNSLQLSLFGEL